MDEEQSQILRIVVPLKAFQAFVNGNHEVVNGEAVVSHFIIRVEPVTLLGKNFETAL